MRRRLVIFLGLALLAAALLRTGQAAPRQPVVVMYATDWCGYCARARAYLQHNGIAFIEHDIEKSTAAGTEFRRLGGRGVPLILVGRERVYGFSELAFEFAYEKASR